MEVQFANKIRALLFLNKYLPSCIFSCIQESPLINNFKQELSDTLFMKNEFPKCSYEEMKEAVKKENN